MALDYSKLTEEELQAIANDDYTKLSDKTLRQLSRGASGTRPVGKKTAPPETAMETFNRSAASTVDTMLGIPGGMVSPVAYAGYRFKQGVESLTNAATGKGFLPTPTAPAEEFAKKFEWKNPANRFSVGNITGTAGTSSYENAPLAAAGQTIGQVVSENVVQPVSNITGIPESDVGNMLGTVSVLAGPIVGRAAATAARPVVSAVKPVAQLAGQAIAHPIQSTQAIVNVGKGFGGTLSGKIAKPGTEPAPYKQVPPVMEPAGKTHIPADVMAEYQANRITPEQAQQAAIPYTAEQIKALERTSGNVPYSGNVAQATGAILAEPYTSFRGFIPDLALAGVGGLLTGGIGGALAVPALNLARKGVQAFEAAKTATAANELGNLKFTPLTPEQRAALTSAQAAGPVEPPPTTGLTGRTFPVEPTPPLLSYSPAGQTPMPMPGPGRRVNIEGESFNLPYQIDTTPVQSARPQPIAPVAPNPMASQVTPEIQQATAEGMAKTTPIAPVKPLTVEPTVDKTPEQLAAEQSILDLINSRRGVATPEPEPIPQAEPKKRIRQEQRIAEREAQMTPEELAAQEAEVARNLAKSTGKKQSTDLKQQYKSPAEMRKALYGKMPEAELEALVNKTFPSPETLLQKMTQTKTPEDAAVAEALRQRLEALAAQGKYRRGKDVSEMMTDTTPRSIGKFADVYPSKEAMDYETMFSTLGEKKTRFTRYQEGNKIIEVEQINYGAAPQDLLRKLNKPSTATRIYDAKTGKQLSGPPKD